MFYDRQVKYLDYMIKKERNGNAGFIKIEVRDYICNINICVKGLRKEDSFPVSVYLLSSDKEAKLCHMELTGGCGTKQLLRLDAANIADTGISYQDWEAVKIPISTDRELYGVLEKSHGQVQRKAEETAVEKTIEEPAAEMQAVSVAEAVVEEEVATVEKPEVKDVSAVEKPQVEKEVSAVEKPQVEVKTVDLDDTIVGVKPQKMDAVKREMPLHENKWKQLWEIYPHVSPFQDGRKYLSVGPHDFVILPEKYFSMVNNSFLLHGFYNYNHLVLKRMEQHGEARYYIGVPGNYYDREKQVAVMFGFESFECMQEPAQTGDFGYYLMRIEL